MNTNVPSCLLATTASINFGITYIHYDEARPVCAEFHAIAMQKQLHEPPNYQVLRCCQHIGDVIHTQLEDNRQTLRKCRSNLRHILRFSSLARAVHDVCGCHSLITATSPRLVFVHARSPRPAGDPWRSREPLCAGDAPAPDQRAAVVETVPSALKCMRKTPGHGLTGLRSQFIFLSKIVTWTPNVTPAFFVY